MAYMSSPSASISSNLVSLAPVGWNGRQMCQAKANCNFLSSLTTNNPRWKLLALSSLSDSGRPALAPVHWSVGAVARHKPQMCRSQKPDPRHHPLLFNWLTPSLLKMLNCKDGVKMKNSRWHLDQLLFDQNVPMQCACLKRSTCRMA